MLPYGPARNCTSVGNPLLAPSKSGSGIRCAPTGCRCSSTSVCNGATVVGTPASTIGVTMVDRPGTHCASHAAGSRRTARRAADLAEQAQNLDDAVTDVERQLVGDRSAAGARAHVWELALAVREVEQYLTTLGSVRGRPSLSTLRTLVSRRAALTARRGLLVDRLEDAQVTRALGVPGSV